MTKTAKRPRGAAWRAHVAELMPALRARADDACELCGGPIDFDATPRSRRSASVDHVVPLHAGGAELPPLDELRLVHYGCNAQRGNRTRRLRAAPPVVAPAVELVAESAPRDRRYARAPRASRRAFEHPALFDDDVGAVEFLSAAATDRKSVV